MSARMWKAAFAAFVLAACHETQTPSSEISALAVANAPAPPPYTLLDISLPNEFNGFATDVNDQGNVVGWSTSDGAWLRRSDGSRVSMGALGGNSASAYAVNNLDQATGFAYVRENVTFHAFVWSPSNGMTDLGSLAGRRGYSTGHGINNHGLVVGESVTRVGTSRVHAFIWMPGEPMHDLGTLGAFPSVARDVNDRNEVVGHSWVPAGEIHAFIWTRGGGMVDLGTLGGSFSAAYGINNLGEVVGESRTATGESHAFLWTATGGMVDLGAMGDQTTVPSDINDHGVIVGTAFFTSSVRAFIRSRTGPFVDLGDLGNIVSRGLGINACAQVAGSSTVASGGSDHAALWTRSC